MTEAIMTFAGELKHAVRSLDACQGADGNRGR